MEDTTSTNNYYKLNSKNIKSVVRTYLVLTKSAHKLTNALIDVLTEFVYEYIVLKSKLEEDELVNTLLFSTTTRNKFKKRLDMDNIRFNNVLSALRKQGIIKGNTINKSIIPNIGVNNKQYKLIFDFNIIVDED